ARGTTGERRELGTLGPGEAIGDMSLLTGEPASADVVAATRVRTWSISPAKLATMGDLRNRVIEALASVLAGRLRRANERLLATYAAKVHALTLRAEDLPLIARLPGVLRRVADAPVLVITVGASNVEALGGADGVAVRQLSLAEADQLPRILKAVQHEYDQVLVLATPDLGLESVRVDSRLALVREHAAPLPPGTSGIAVTSRPWTQPNLRNLSQASGSHVIAVVPHQPPPPGRGDVIAKLARVIAGKQVGLALGAGAAKGFAHIGVLRAFEEVGIDIDMITGCSIGSAIAAGYAAGYSVSELSQVADRIAARAVRPTLPLHSFLSSRGLREELEKVGRGRRFEDLDIPLAIPATDLYRRCEVTFTTGLVWPRILASMSIPGIYPALRGPDSYLVDGGVLNPVPSRQCREMGAGVVIGIRLTARNTSPRDDLDASPSRPFAAENILRCLEIMHNRLSELSRNEADVSIDICLERGGLRDFNLSAEIIRTGYEETMAARASLEQAMPYVRQA
ncbi:MAG: patatin-like phospholipase family protein, partial [Chloroflexi bacterium]|nr:patatin-like phospholipase family protein [Chloroflexota bacterium]